MKLICTLLIATGLCVQGIVPVMAQEVSKPAPLSLQDCISIAMKYQSDIQIGKNSVTVAKNQSTQAKSEYYPQVSLQNNAFQVGSQGVLNQANTGTALVISQNIYDGGVREAKVKGTKYGVVQNTAGLTRTTQTVTFDVTTAYYEALRNKHLTDVAAASVKYNESLLETVQARVDVGDAAKSDLLPVESQLANAKVSLLAAQNNLNIALVQLENTMGLSPQIGFDIQEAPAVPNKEIQPMDTYTKMALASRPDITEFQAAVVSAQSARKVARILLYPQPVIEGQYQQGILRSSGQNSAQIFGGISFNVFDGNRARASYNEANANVSTATQRSTQINRDIQAQVQGAYMNLTSAKERLSASDLGLEAAQKNYDAQLAKYQQGLAITLDLLNAEVQVVTAQTNAVQARYDFYTAIAQMQFAVGKQGGLNG